MSKKSDKLFKRIMKKFDDYEPHSREQSGYKAGCNTFTDAILNGDYKLSELKKCAKKYLKETTPD